MRAFLDFEASSLGDDSYPIEVGWVFEDGSEEQHLIRPAPGWTDWDESAEALHGLSRERLEREGEPHDQVARRLLDVLSPHIVYVSAPSWDGKWLSVLLRAAGLPRHAMRFRPSEEALFEAAFEAAMARGMVEAQAMVLAGRIIETARAEARDRTPAHRALEDAKQELRLWREVRVRAQSVRLGD